MSGGFCDYCELDDERCRCITIPCDVWENAKLAWQTEICGRLGDLHDAKAIDALFSGDASVMTRTVDRSEHSCRREHGFSLLSASTCDGCGMEYLQTGADIIGLARACTGIDRFKLGSDVDPPGRAGIQYEGAPSEEQRERAHVLWRRLCATEAR